MKSAFLIDRRGGRCHQQPRAVALDYSEVGTVCWIASFGAKLPLLERRMNQGRGIEPRRDFHNRVRRKMWDEPF
jgi:hypothetical protein